MKESICIYQQAIKAEGLKHPRWDGPSQAPIAPSSSATSAPQPRSSTSPATRAAGERWEKEKQHRDKVTSISRSIPLPICVPVAPTPPPVPGHLIHRSAKGNMTEARGIQRQQLCALPSPLEGNVAALAALGLHNRIWRGNPSALGNVFQAKKV